MGSSGHREVKMLKRETKSPRSLDVRNEAAQTRHEAE